MQLIYGLLHTANMVDPALSRRMVKKVAGIAARSRTAPARSDTTKRGGSALPPGCTTSACSRCRARCANAARNWWDPTRRGCSVARRTLERGLRQRAHRARRTGRDDRAPASRALRQPRLSQRPRSTTSRSTLNWCSSPKCSTTWLPSDRRLPRVRPRLPNRQPWRTSIGSPERRSTLKSSMGYGS